MAERLSRAEPLLARPRRWRLQKLRGVLAEEVLRLSGWSLAAAAMLSEADRFWSPGHAARWGIWWGMLAVLAAALWVLFVQIRRACGWRDVLSAAENKFPELRGRLLSAWDLARHPEDPATSRTLREAHMERTRNLLRGLSPEPLFKWKPSRGASRAAAAGILGAAFLLWARPAASLRRVFAPWADRPLEAFLKVSPGSARIAWGQSASVSASWTPDSLVARAPQDLKLWIEDGEGWRAAPWDRRGGGSAEFKAENLTAAFKYKMSWHGLFTASYALTPVPSPGWKRLDATVEGLNQDETIALDGSSAPRFLIGSRIILEGTPSEGLARAEVLFSSPHAVLPMLRGQDGRFAAAFDLTHGVSFHFELTALDGRRNASAPEYAIAALTDEPPAIQMLAPDAPVSADVDGEIPISYAVQDDGGVSRVSIIIRGKDGKTVEKDIRNFNPPPKDDIGDYDWSLSGLSPGRAWFRLKAYDNAAPPHWAVSRWQVANVADWEKIRREERALWGESQAQLDALAPEESRYLEFLRKNKSGPSSHDALSQNAETLARNWRAASEDSTKLSDALSRDPGANPGFAQSLADFAQALRRAAARDIPEAERARRTGNLAKAEGIHRSLANLAARGKNLLAAGLRARDWQAAAAKSQDLSLSAASFLGDLARRPRAALSGQARQALEQKLSRIESQLNTLARQIQSLASAAPAPPGSSAQSLPLQSAMDAARSLESALASGDARAAERLADELSKDLSQISRALQGASSGAMSQVEAAATRQAQAAAALWSKVILDEQDARAVAQELDSRRTARRIRRQKDVLAALEKKQSALISSAEAAAFFPSGVLEQMKNVESQFAARQVSDAGARLQDVIGVLRGATAGVGKGKTLDTRIAQGEEDVLERLRQARQQSEARPDVESAAQAARQGRILAETGSLEEGLRGLRQDGFEMPSEALGDVSRAAGEERAAQGALSEGDVRHALFHQDKALSLLNAGQSSLSRALGGRRRAFSLELSPSGSGGMTLGGASGANAGMVPLPSARDYLPPGVLRGELEQSLGEKKPAAYAPIIREYFQRIAQ
ncbi:MAG TPA: hypothetical protein VNH15_01545 [Elusimicrobiota bacterium]|nr:hypothetical protein [Elusimicrobiota bacterium]